MAREKGSSGANKVREGFFRKISLKKVKIKKYQWIELS
jgi:hypothetical protein